MDLRIKDDNDELNDLESELLNEIELLRHEQGLSASLTELDSGMSEFGRPPRSISRDSFDECIKNLISLQELIEGHPKHREELNVCLIPLSYRRLRSHLSFNRRNSWTTTQMSSYSNGTSSITRALQSGKQGYFFKMRSTRSYTRNRSPTQDCGKEPTNSGETTSSTRIRFSKLRTTTVPVTASAITSTRR